MENARMHAGRDPRFTDRDWPYDNPRREDLRDRSAGDDWHPDTKELLRQLGLCIPVCRGPKCGPGNRCDNCDCTIKYLDCIYRQREDCALDLRRLRNMCKVFPEEVRDALAGIVLDILDAKEQTE